MWNGLLVHPLSGWFDQSEPEEPKRPSDLMPRTVLWSPLRWVIGSHMAERQVVALPSLVAVRAESSPEGTKQSVAAIVSISKWLSWSRGRSREGPVPSLVAESQSSTISRGGAKQCCQVYNTCIATRSYDSPYLRSDLRLDIFLYSKWHEHF